MSTKIVKKIGSLSKSDTGHNSYIWKVPEVYLKSNVLGEEVLESDTVEIKKQIDRFNIQLHISGYDKKCSIHEGNDDAQYFQNFQLSGCFFTSTPRKQKPERKMKFFVIQIDVKTQLESRDEVTVMSDNLFKLKYFHTLNLFNLIDQQTKCLRLECEIPFLNEVEEEAKEILASKLDFSNLLLNDEFSDMSLVVKGEKDGEYCELRVHRAILASQSPVFSKMLNSNMKEKTEGKVTIEEFDYRTMSEILKFLYSGSLNRDDLFGIESRMIKAADYFALDELKNLMATVIAGSLSDYNTFEYLMLADTYNAPNLKQKCLEYIVFLMDEITFIKGVENIPTSCGPLLKELLIATRKLKHDESVDYDW